MGKRILAVLLSAILALGCCTTAFAADFTAEAQDLQSAGLFNGTDKGFELDREATRVEAAVMLVRLLGKEAEAKAQFDAGTIVNPFTDVPVWANAYVAWLYSQSLTKGISQTQFGTGKCSGQMFATFALRALGYTEAAGDFTYATALDTAADLGLYDALTMAGTFCRDELVAMADQTLATTVKGGAQSLLEKLVADGAVDAAAAKALLEKQAALRSYNAACMALGDMNAMAMTMKMKMDVSTENVTVVTTVSDMTASVITDPTDLTKLQMAISGKMTMGGETTDYQEWVKDGWMYMNMGASKVKAKMGLDALQDALDSATVSADSMPIYYVDAITKTTSGSNTVYTMTCKDSYSDLISSMIGDLDETLGVDAVKLGKMTIATTFDAKGALKAERIQITMSATTTQDGETFQLDYIDDIDMQITATGSAVKVTYPDFSDYVEGPLEDIA
ncbi:MAG: hypothetical protein PHS97_02045 [Oscillospiraceae bacterium]|nr:hypothetical protein [Oscillospiraceae bacterium]